MPGAGWISCGTTSLRRRGADDDGDGDVYVGMIGDVGLGEEDVDVDYEGMCRRPP